MAAVEKTAATFGGIDICVNNASAIQLTGTLQTDMKRYDLMNGINARGTYLTGRTCIPYLKTCQLVLAARHGAPEPIVLVAMAHQRLRATRRPSCTTPSAPAPSSTRSIGGC